MTRIACDTTGGTEPQFQSGTQVRLPRALFEIHPEGCVCRTGSHSGPMDMVCAPPEWPRPNIPRKLFSAVFYPSLFGLKLAAPRLSSRLYWFPWAAQWRRIAEIEIAEIFHRHPMKKRSGEYVDALGHL